MKNSSLSAAAVLAAGSVLFLNSTLAHALSCAEVAPDNGDFSEYFTDSSDSKPRNKTYRSQLLRKSVAAYYGNLSPSLSDEEVDAMGEGVSFGKVKDPDGNEYISVNVGFGGGNSATFLYYQSTLNLVPVMAIDGTDCIDQGSMASFPIEKSVRSIRGATATCELSDGEAPISSFTLRVPLSGNTAFATSGSLELGESTDLVEGVSFALDKRKIEVEYPSKKVSTIISAKGEKEGIEWTAQTGITLEGDEATVSGKTYPNVTGGYWSKEAKEFKATFTCDSNIQVDEVKYQRVISY